MDNLSKERARVDALSRKYEKLLEIIPTTYKEKDNVLKLISLSYSSLMKNKKTYEKNLQLQYESRELSKQKAFKTSMLNIDLPKFKGYKSQLDIYSFQDEFEKLYKEQHTKKRLCDLLKNNFLEEPAISLVKSLDNIDEVWTRLQKAYGDSRVLLQHKLGDVRQMCPLHKIKDQEKLKEAGDSQTSEFHA